MNLKLNKKQSIIARKAIIEKQNLFVTGSAGVGKSFLLKYIVNEFKKIYNQDEIAVTASTGTASVTIDGYTLHSWAGFGHDGKKTLKLFYIKRWEKTKLLIIDEISMLSSEYFDTIAPLIIKNRIQLLCFGDFLQLPPVKGESCFNSNNWSLLKLDIGTVELTEVMRQKDKEFIKVLNEIRKGNITPQSCDYLKKFDINEIEGGLRPSLLEHYTKLYTLNVNVDQENLDNLNKINNEDILLKSHDLIINKKTKLEEDLDSLKEFERIMLSREALSTIQLRIGCEIIVTRNMHEIGIVNGTRGVLKNYCSRDGIKLPLIKLVNGNEVFINPIEYEIEFYEYKVIRKQFPIKLAWALTVHRSQSLTLPHVFLSVHGSFARGQIYTGISRIKDVNNLVIDNVDELVKLNKVCPSALGYYNKYCAPVILGIVVSNKFFNNISSNIILLKNFIEFKEKDCIFVDYILVNDIKLQDLLLEELDIEIKLENSLDIKKDKKRLIKDSTNLLFFWDNKSQGTRFCINYSNKLNKKIDIISI